MQPADGLTSAEAAELQQKYGKNEVASKQQPAWQKIAWRYLDWVSLVILTAAIVSATVPNEGERGWTSFVLLILELNLIVWVGYYSDRNAGNAVKELETLSAPSTTVKRDGQWQTLAVKELVPGDLIQLKGGDIVPADAKLAGNSDHEPLTLDESSLTGESLPVKRRPGQQVLAGAVVTQGELEGVVTATGRDSFFGKTMALLATPEEPGHLKKVLNRVSVAMAIVALVFVLIILLVLLIRGAPIGYVVVTVFVIFVAVVPIGMPVVVGTVLALGARELASEKAIVSRLSALEELSGMEVLASDKTGTLTLNKLTLDKQDILAWGNASKDEVLLMASLSARWSNNDAIDSAVVNALGGNEQAIAQYTVDKFVPFNPVDKRTMATVVFPDGSRAMTSKGAPQVIADMLDDKAASQACMQYIDERASRGLRSLGVARSVDNGVSWELVGLISLLDPPREDTAETIRRAQAMGVVVKMVTGDQKAIAIETCRRLGMGVDIMEGKALMEAEVDFNLAQMVDHVDGFAGVFPEHKHRIVEALQAKGRLVGMTGDGVNDAPALKKANIGIAVAGATAAAKGAADIILTQEGISTIITAISRSRGIFRRLQTYIIYRVASSMLILSFFFVAILAFDFEIPTWVLVLISLCNDLSVMAISFDKVYSAEKPDTWNMVRNMAVALAIAGVGLCGMVLLVPLADPTRWNAWTGFHTKISEEPESSTASTSGQLVAIIFLALSALIQLNIILTRNPGFWWEFKRSTAPRPSIILVIPVVLFLLASTFIAVYWPRNIKPDGGRGSMEGAGWAPVALTWAYVIFWWALADVAKWAMQRLFDKQEAIKDVCKENGTQTPTWVSAVDAPGRWGDHISMRVERFTKVVTKTFCGKCTTGRPMVRRPASMAEIDTIGLEPSRAANRRRTATAETELEWGNRRSVQPVDRPSGSLAVDSAPIARNSADMV
ncbi:hypothetical protein WJX72_001191 [[Myrmecia] bisecta]|uniref:Plasma membrane ATPase n=1 Tax=[Myrmecia] bisecta TaxID=41462 RepID=A0AAW1QEB9_9CHLO